MDAELAAIKRVHDAAMQLGASCHESCMFGGAQDQPDAYDSYGKSYTYTELRSRGLLLLSTLN